MSAAGLALLLAAAAQVPDATNPAAAFDAGTLAAIDAVVAEGIAAGEMPGCVVLIGRRGGVAFRKAYGRRAVEPHPEPMTADTRFDLASLTKPVCTAACVAHLADRGLLDLDAPVADRLPAFGRRGKAAITPTQLLTHTAGLIADNPLADYAAGPDAAWAAICDLEPRSAPGERFVYSDVGYVVLGELIEQVSGRSLDEYAAEHLYRPLGMTRTGFNPPPEVRGGCAPTERRGGEWLRGEVHDPRAAALGGVAGHAGLFSTSDDLALFARMLLGRGELRTAGGPVRVLSAAAVDRMTAPRAVPGGRRSLGWDVRTAYSANRGDLFSDAAFGHGGFTGTALWVDPERDLFAVFLSNRLHPDGRGSVNRLIGRINTIAAAALRD